MAVSADTNRERGAGTRMAADACDVESIHPEAVERALGQALGGEQAADLGRLFQVMADPSRLRIISLLASGELCVCDIAAALKMTQSAVSHQLRLLRIAELVRYRKEGRIAYYSLSDDHVLSLFETGLEHIGHSPAEGRV